MATEIGMTQRATLQPLATRVAAALAPAYWLSLQNGIAAGVGGLLWVALSSGWMIVRGVYASDPWAPEPGSVYALAPDPTPASA